MGGHRFHETFIDNSHARTTAKQRGPTAATVIDQVRDATPEEWRATEQLTRSTAARQGWDSDGGLPLADVLDELGIKP